MRILLLLPLLLHLQASATVHQVQVWNGYYQFLPNYLTINLGDTIRWVPLDAPTMAHTITSTNIPAGAASFDVPFALPSDTLFEYVPTVAGLYEYECTPHISFGMIGQFTVVDPAGLDESESSRIRAYPNPANEVLNVELTHDEAFDLLDASGRVVLTSEGSGIIEVGGLENGVYLIKLRGDKTSPIQIVVEH